MLTELGKVKTVVLSLSVFLFIFKVVLAFLAALLRHINFRIILRGFKTCSYDRCIKISLKPYVLLLYCLATTL